MVSYRDIAILNLSFSIEHFLLTPIRVGWVYDITDLSHVTPVWQESYIQAGDCSCSLIGGESPMDFSWPYLYIFTECFVPVPMVWAVDFSDPAHPEVLGCAPENYENWREIKVWEGYLYVLAKLWYEDDYVLDIFDVRENPIPVNRVNRLYLPEGHILTVKNGYLYFFSSGTLFIYDLHLPYDPQLVSQVDINAFFPLEHGASRGFFHHHRWEILGYQKEGREDPRIAFLDVFNPFQPQIVSSFILPGYLHEYFIRGPVGFFSDKEGKLEVVDLRNPQAVTLWEDFPLPDGVSEVYPITFLDELFVGGLLRNDERLRGFYNFNNCISYTRSYLPAIAHAKGALGTYWKTDLRLYNPTDTWQTVVFGYFWSGMTNPYPMISTWPIAPGEEVWVEDAVERLFESYYPYGALRVEATGPVEITAWTYNKPEYRRSEGVQYSAIPEESAWGKGEVVIIDGLKQSVDYHTNVGWVNISGEPLELVIQAYDGEEFIGEVSLTLKPYEHRQINYFFWQFTGEEIDQGKLFIEGMTEGHWIGYGTIIENVTAEPTIVFAEKTDLSFLSGLKRGN